MTKEEIKANELIEMFSIVGWGKGWGKEMAIICVDDIIKEVILFKQYSMG